MQKLTRRQFVQQMMIGGLTLPFLARSLEGELFAQSSIQRQPLIWLQGHTAGIHQAGIWSLPQFQEYLVKYFHVLSWNQLNFGKDFQKLEKSEIKPILILEGAFGSNQDFEVQTKLLEAYLENARAVIFLGNEACYGLFNQGEHLNLLTDLLEGKNIPYLKLPGSAVSAGHLLGTLNHLYLYGVPELDEEARPVMFYSELICDRCEFRGDFERGNFIEFFGQGKGCLYLLGCKGRVTKNTCPIEKWNGTQTWCVSAGSPCTGCSEPTYPNHSGVGMYGQPTSSSSSMPASWIRNTNGIAKVLLGVTTAGVIVHGMSDSSPTKLEDDLSEYYGEDESL